MIGQPGILAISSQVARETASLLQRTFYLEPLLARFLDVVACPTAAKHKMLVAEEQQLVLTVFFLQTAP